MVSSALVVGDTSPFFCCMIRRLLSLFGVPSAEQLSVETDAL